jgi:hypothetical protein
MPNCFDAPFFVCISPMLIAQAYTNQFFIHHVPISFPFKNRMLKNNRSIVLDIIDFKLSE